MLGAVEEGVGYALQCGSSLKSARNRVTVHPTFPPLDCASNSSMGSLLMYPEFVIMITDLEKAQFGQGRGEIGVCV